MRRISLPAATFLAFLAGACAADRAAAPARPALPPPVEAAPSAEAAREVTRLRAAAPSMGPDRAAEAWEQLARTYPAAAEAADALWEAARLRREARRPDLAARDLGELLGRYPLSPRAPQARLEYGLAELESGRPDEGMLTLDAVWKETPRDRRAPVAARIAGAAEAGKAWPLAARWWAEVAQASPGPEGDRALARAVEIVDARLGRLQLARLAEELPATSPLAPAASLKLAKVQQHVGETEIAERAIREHLDRWPRGAYAAEARAMLDRIERRGRSDPRLLGLAVPLSGKFKAWGEAIVQGVALAIPEGSGFRVATRDTRGEADGAVEAVRLLAADGAVAVIGAVTNAEGPRAAATAQELGVPLLSLSKVEGVTGIGPFVFRVMLTASAQAAALAEFAVARRGLRRFAVLYPDIPYGTELMGAFWDEVEARGGEFRGAGAYEADRTTFGPMVKDLVGKLHLDERPDWVELQKEALKGITDPYRRSKALEKARKELPPVVDFEAIFVPDFARNVTLLAPALAVEDVVTTCDPRELERIRKVTPWEVRPVQLLGGNGWDDPALFEKAGRYVECAVFVDGFFPGSERPATRAFVQAFQERNGRAPSILEASAYDAARMVVHAVEKGRAEGREAVRAWLAGLRDFPGATGDIGFDARGEPVRPLFFLTVDRTGVREMTAAEMAGPPPGNP
jgi:ABC-type branched-subunit amino acid transport system substrate-binding protein